MLRIYAEEADLDFSRAKETLTLTLPDEFVESAFTDDDQEIGIIKFRASSPVRTPRGGLITPGQSPQEFLSATAWLRARSPSQFDALRSLGLAFDLFVQGYLGSIPVDLIRELSRLGLSLWVAPAGFREGLVR